MSRRTENILLLIFAIALVIIVGLLAWNNHMPDDEPENTWAASAEFYQLESGQDRFSEHSTNIWDTIVIVDHDTGIQYLSNENGMTVLLEEDGTPKRVAEAE
jgi:hypothetical protein